MGGPGFSTAFVGRSDTLAAVLDRLSGRTRGPTAVIVAGEAGVGKTRLAEAAIAVLATEGVDVDVVRVTPAIGSITLGALAALQPPSDPRADWPGGRLADAAHTLAARSDRVTVLDDAHLLDATTAAAIHLALTLGAPPMLLTMRTGETADPAITSLWKDELAHRIDLTPLDRCETAELAADLLGTPLDGVSENDLWAATRGNPLFVRELVVGAREGGWVERVGDVHRFTSRPRVSARLAELLQDRLDDVGPDERDALEVLAVGGDRDIDELRSLCGDVVLARLEACSLVEVGDLAGDGRTSIRLTHPLYAELIRERMGTIRWATVHRTLADRVEARGPRDDVELLDLARWRLVGGGESSPDLLTSAARQALFRFESELAYRLGVLARQNGAGIDADLIVAEALNDLGRRFDAAELMRSVLDTAGDTLDVVQAATTLAVIQFWSLGDETAAIATLDEAITRIDDPQLVAQLDANVATFLAMSNRPREAIERVTGHLDGVPTDKAFMIAVIAAGPALTAAGRALDSIALVDRCIPERMATVDAAIPDTFQYTMSKVYALSEAGSIDAAATLAEETYDLASALRAVPAVAWAAMLRGVAALNSGAAVRADRSFAEAAALFADLNEAGLRSWSLSGAVLAAAMAGDAKRTAGRLADLDACDPGTATAMQGFSDRAHAWAHRVGGDLRAAATTLEAGVVHADDRGAWGVSVALLHDLVRIGADAAPLLRTEHRAVQGCLATARLAMIDGWARRDAELLTEAAERFASAGSPLFAAEAWSLAATAHARTGATRVAAACRVRAARHRADCESVRTPLLAPVDVAVRLTDREREIAELAAAGLTNLAIADRLGRSIRTIENHLQRTFEKLGLAGRHDLIAALESIDDG